MANFKKEHLMLITSVHGVSYGPRISGLPELVQETMDASLRGAARLIPSLVRIIVCLLGKCGAVSLCIAVTTANTVHEMSC